MLSSAIVHHRFETIHPFADGNGRAGRALSLWELYRRGFDSHHIFAVDEFYWEDRPRYYAALDAVRREGDDLTSWLEYCAEGLRQTLERVWERMGQLSLSTSARTSDSAAAAGAAAEAARPERRNDSVRPLGCPEGVQAGGDGFASPVGEGRVSQASRHAEDRPLPPELIAVGSNNSSNEGRRPDSALNIHRLSRHATTAKLIQRDFFIG